MGGKVQPVPTHLYIVLDRMMDDSMKQLTLSNQCALKRLCVCWDKAMMEVPKSMASGPHKISFLEAFLLLSDYEASTQQREITYSVLFPK